MDVTFIVGTFGARMWLDMAEERAIPSCQATGRPVIHIHGDTLAKARNEGVAKAVTEWVCIVDADDEISRDFADQAAKVSGDLLAPRYVEVHPDGRRVEIDLSLRDMERMNSCSISTMIRKQHFLDLGGFREWRGYEDWALWLTAHRRGLRIARHDGVHWHHELPHSRNQTITDPAALTAEIRLASW